MSADETQPGTRRDFLTGRALRRQIEQGGAVLAETVTAAEEDRPPLRVGTTVRLQTTAMACDFAVLLNPDHGEQLPAASAALDLVHALEAQMTVFREESELSHINRRAFSEAVEVEEQLFGLLQLSRRLAEETGGAFDPTAGPLIALWKEARRQQRLPTPAEIEAVRSRMGVQQVVFEEEARTVRFRRPGLRWDLGGIGKGYALDRIAARLEEGGVRDFLLHGGHSSLLARGTHADCGGWPVGIRHPYFPKRKLTTVLLRDCALSTSGSGVQFFRHGGRRYGHILDPRSGQPAEGMLSVTVVAPTAAAADALSTAFFVMGLEKSAAYCDNRKEIGALLVPLPRRGHRLEPVLCNLDPDCIFRE